MFRLTIQHVLPKSAYATVLLLELPNAKEPTFIDAAIVIPRSTDDAAKSVRPQIGTKEKRDNAPVQALEAPVEIFLL